MTSRGSLAVLVALIARSASADAPVGDQGIEAAIGIDGGGGWTPGGAHVDGGYMLALDDRDWLELGLGLTLGGGRAACTQVDANGYACNHGLLQGEAAALQSGVRHVFGTSGVRPFVHVGASISVIRFPSDVVTTMTYSMAMPAPVTGMYGVAIDASAGGGLIVPYSSSVAFTARAELSIGVGAFAGTADGQRQLGGRITGGVEVRR